MYDPTTARFLQEDSYLGDINDPLSLNLYTYCNNEPMMHFDPTGNFASATEELFASKFWNKNDNDEMKRLGAEWHRYNNKKKSNGALYLEEFDMIASRAEKLRKRNNIDGTYQFTNEMIPGVNDYHGEYYKETHKFELKDGEIVGYFGNTVTNVSSNLDIPSPKVEIQPVKPEAPKSSTLAPKKVVADKSWLHKKALRAMNITNNALTSTNEFIYVDMVQLAGFRDVDDLMDFVNFATMGSAGGAINLSKLSRSVPTLLKGAFKSLRSMFFKKGLSKTKPDFYVGPEGNVSKSLSQYDIYVDESSNVWDSIKTTQPIYKNTQIPKSFELSTMGEKFWVHPNATKHMDEYITAQKYTHGMPMNSQSLLKSFQNSVSSSVIQGIKYDEIMNIGNWELIFTKGRGGDLLPVIKHAVYRP